ncbi:hypothetical protein NL676_013091 [Syzygium grande]|nr:hypothetical protein NL676_013091 [Syzygium grande]
MLSFRISTALNPVTRTVLRANTMLTENTMSEALPCYLMAFCTTKIPRSNATKQARENIRAISVCSIPDRRYCSADIVDEEKTMNEQVAAVTCKTNCGLWLTEFELGSA